MTTFPLINVIATGSVAATGVAGITTAFIYKDKIVEIFKAQPSSENADVQYSYVVATYKAPTHSLPVAKPLEPQLNYLAKYSDSKIVKDYYEDIKMHVLALPPPNDNSPAINFSTFDKTKTINHSALTSDTNYLIKLSNKAVATIVSSESKSFSLTSQENKEVDFGSFVLASGIVSEVNKKLQISHSSIVVVRLSQDTSITEATISNDLQCSIGGTKLNVSCRAYSFETEPTNTFGQSNIETLSLTINKDSHLKKDKYLLIDLLGQTTSLKELEHKLIVLKKNQSKEVASGIVEQLLVGNINQDKPADSKAFFVQSPQSSLSLPSTSVENAKRFVLTEGGNLHVGLSSQAYAAGDFLCRVVVDSTKYDDENCKLYKFGTDTANFAFDPTTYVDSSVINAIDDLKTSKFQLVELSKTLQDHLNAAKGSFQPKLELISTGGKNNAWNNTLVSLTKVKDIAVATDKLVDLKSNALLVRVKEVVNLTDPATIPADTEFNCHISKTDPAGEGDAIPCKLYEFKAHKLTNNIPHTDFASMSSGKVVSAAFAANNYYVLAFEGAAHTASALQNKTISLKLKNQPTKKVGSFLFDQLVYGQPAKAAALAKKKEAIFVVERTTDGSNTGNLTTPYRCRLAASPSTNIDNYDDTCVLTKLPALEGTTKILPFPKLKVAPTTGAGSFVLKSDADYFYKLTVDLNKLYNIDLNALTTSDTHITVEVIPTAGSSSTDLFGKVKLMQDITSDPSKGKTTLLIGSVKQTSSITGNLEKAKCTFVGESKEPIGCTPHKNKTTTDTTNDPNKAEFTKTEKPSVADDYSTGKLLLLELDTAQDITGLLGKEVVYKKGEGAENKDTDNVTLTIKGVVGGSLETSKRIYFLSTPTNP